MQRGVVSGKAPASNKEVEEMAHHVNSKNRVRGVLFVFFNDSPLTLLTEAVLMSVFHLQAAQAAQMRSTALFQCLFFRERDPQTDPCCVADAVVYSIRDNGVLVFIPE